VARAPSPVVCAPSPVVCAPLALLTPSPILIHDLVLFNFDIMIFVAFGTKSRKIKQFAENREILREIAM